jgi:hypothetical protein
MMMICFNCSHRQNCCLQIPKYKQTSRVWRLKSISTQSCRQDKKGKDSERKLGIWLLLCFYPLECYFVFTFLTEAALPTAIGEDSFSIGVKGWSLVMPAPKKFH